MPAGDPPTFSYSPDPNYAIRGVGYGVFRPGDMIMYDYLSVTGPVPKGSKMARARKTAPKKTVEVGPQFVIVNGDIYVRVDEDGYPYTVSYTRFMSGPTGQDCFYTEAMVAFLNEHKYMEFEKKWEEEHPDPDDDRYHDEMGG